MPDSTPNRSRARHLGPQRRRPQVLDAALQIAAERGVAGVTIAAIAERLGVTRPVVYACYDGRGEVLAALLDRETELMLTGLIEALPPQRDGSIEDRFVAGFQALLTAVRERPAAWRILFAADQDPVLSAAVVSGPARLAGRVAKVMRPLLTPEVTSEQTLMALTEVFMAICEASARMLLSSEQQWTPQGLAEVVGPAAYRIFAIG